MEKLKTAFNNNRSRVAVALGALGDVVIYAACDALGISTDTAHVVAAGWTTWITAYIVGNGRYEANQVLVEGAPPPKK